jgi:hypothetical protein
MFKEVFFEKKFTKVLQRRMNVTQNDWIWCVRADLS